VRPALTCCNFIACSLQQAVGSIQDQSNQRACVFLKHRCICERRAHPGDGAVEQQPPKADGAAHQRQGPHKALVLSHKVV